MQTIITKYIGATNGRGARIKATSSLGQSVSLPYPHELKQDERHAHACRALAIKFGWGDVAFIGGTLNKHGHMVWVVVDNRSPRA